MLYLIVNILSISIPLLFSFHKKIKFYIHHKIALITIIISGLSYISWDIIFTRLKIWGFNPKHLIGFNIFHLPIEEWLFFLCIPYSCLFTYFTLKKIAPNFHLNNVITTIFKFLLVISLLLVAIIYNDKMYTSINALCTLFILLLGIYIEKKHHLKIFNYFFIHYVVLLLPFTLVNGTLTGMFTSEEVVWYNNQENIALRFITIPYEDFIYAMGIILLPIVLFEFFIKKNTHNENTSNNL